MKDRQATTLIAQKPLYNILLVNIYNKEVYMINQVTYNRILDLFNTTTSNNLCEFNYFSKEGTILRKVVTKDEYDKNIIVLWKTSLAETLYG